MVRFMQIVFVHFGHVEDYGYGIDFAIAWSTFSQFAIFLEVHAMALKKL